MKKNGFTLLEMLAVVILLTLIALVAFPSLIASIDRNKESQWELTLNIMYNAADIYINDRRANIPELTTPNSKILIPLNYLIEVGLLDSNLTDPRESEDLDIYSAILLTIDDDKIGTYSYPAECGTDECSMVMSPN